MFFLFILFPLVLIYLLSLVIYFKYLKNKGIIFPAFLSFFLAFSSLIFHFYIFMGAFSISPESCNFLLGLPIDIFAMIFGTSSLRQMKINKNKKGRIFAITGIILAVLQILATFGFFGFININSVLESIGI